MTSLQKRFRQIQSQLNAGARTPPLQQQSLTPSCCYSLPLSEQGSSQTGSFAGEPGGNKHDDDIQKEVVAETIKLDEADLKMFWDIIYPAAMGTATSRSEKKWSTFCQEVLEMRRVANRSAPPLTQSHKRSLSELLRQQLHPQAIINDEAQKEHLITTRFSSPSSSQFLSTTQGCCCSLHAPRSCSSLEVTAAGPYTGTTSGAHRHDSSCSTSFASLQQFTSENSSAHTIADDDETSTSFFFSTPPPSEDLARSLDLMDDELQIADLSTLSSGTNLGSKPSTLPPPGSVLPQSNTGGMKKKETAKSENLLLLALKKKIIRCFYSSGITSHLNTPQA